MSVVISKNNKGLVIHALGQLLEEVLYPGASSSARQAVMWVLERMASAPDDISVNCVFQTVSERKSIQISLEIMHVEHTLPHQDHQAPSH